MPKERWMFGYRFTEVRTLDARELEEARNLARRWSALRYWRGSVAVIAGLLAISGIILATEFIWGWGVLILGTIFFFWSLYWANLAEGTSLLFRRTARLGRVDRYSWDSDAPLEVRRAWKEPDTDHECLGEYWKEEEVFIEFLTKKIGHLPLEIELPFNDDVLVTLEGNWIDHIVSAYVVTIDHPELEP